MYLILIKTSDNLCLHMYFIIVPESFMTLLQASLILKKAFLNAFFCDVGFIV